MKLLLIAVLFCAILAPALARANNNQLRILMEMMGRQMEEQELLRGQQEQQQNAGLDFFDGSFVQNSDLETGVEFLNVTQVDMFN